MDLSVKILIAFMLIVLISLNPDALFADEENPSTLLMIDDRCTVSPCLFGQSLHEMSYNQVQQLLAVSEMRENLLLVDAPRQLIRWVWSSEIAPILGVEAYPEIMTDDEYNHLSEFDEFSGIGFREGVADIVWLRFETQLSTLVDIYGDPSVIDPLTYSRFGDLSFRIYFEQVEGYFLAMTRCDHPELVSSTRIKGYFSQADGFLSEYAIPWQGYTDDLPDCSIFQP